MKTTDAILRRRSVRTYTGKELEGDLVQKITEYIASLKAPFGADCRIELVRASASSEPVKLGTYGAIRGANDYLALVLRDMAPMTQTGAAYMLEQTVLYCTSLGLGTCWLAGFFDRGSFKKQLSMRRGEKLRSVSPVGYASDKPHKSLSTLMSRGRPTPRKPFSELFFKDNFGEPLPEPVAGLFAKPLEMVRRAPSANNKQPWRVVMEKQALHFYKYPSMGFENLDMGIALCHFEQTCLEDGLSGHYEVLGDAPKGEKATYVISWVV